MFLFRRNVIILATALSLSGCGIPLAQGVTEGTQANNEYINLYCKLEEKSKKDAVTEPLAIEFHVDGSGSMLGYINNENSSYVRGLKLLDSVLELSGSRSQSSVKYYRSGDYKYPAKELTRSEFRKAFKPEFYNGTTFPAVSSDLASLITTPKNRDRLTIIVTDLEQNDGDVNLIANKIKKSYFEQKNENYAVGIWAIKSEFNGTVYSATDANKKFNYSTEGKTTKQYRPFYVLFLGHEQDIANYFDKLQKDLGTLSDRTNLSIFSPQQILADTAYLTPATNLPSELTSPSSLHNGKVAVEKNNQPVELLEIINRNTNSIEVQNRVTLQTKKHSLSIDPNDIKTQITATAFDEGSKEFKPEITTEKALEFKNWQLDNNQLNFTTTIYPSNFPQSNIYYFKVDVMANDLQKPEWWSEWNLNTGNDGSKTSNLYNFMNGLKNITLNSMDKSDLTVARFCYGIQKN